MSRLTAASFAMVVVAASMVLPIAVVAPLGVATLVGFIATEISTRHMLADYAAWRDRVARRRDREGALFAAGCSHEPLAELERLAAAVELRDPELAQRLDIEALLDRHVALMVAHTRALKALAMTDHVQLLHIRDSIRSDPDRDPRRLDLCERRLRYFDDCQAKAQRLADELAVVADLVHLIAQRALDADELPPDDSIESCLAELDARDDAATVASR